MTAATSSDTLYRGPLFVHTSNGRAMSDDLVGLITDAQWARLAQWSYMYQRSVKDILEAMSPMMEQEHDSSDKCRMVGQIPYGSNDTIFGCISSGGSTHT
jgi:hypothetical protein